MATRGTLFANAHCQAPICNPSRTSVMTGLRPSTTGVYVNRPFFRQTLKNKDRVTLPQYFGKHGYKTLTTGKLLKQHSQYNDALESFTHIRDGGLDWHKNDNVNRDERGICSSAVVARVCMQTCARCR